MNSVYTGTFNLRATVDFLRQNNSELEPQQGKLGLGLKRSCNILMTFNSRNIKGTFFFFLACSYFTQCLSCCTGTQLKWKHSKLNLDLNYS